MKLANNRVCKLSYSTGSIITCKNVTKLPSNVPIIIPASKSRKIGCLSARNKKRYKITAKDYHCQQLINQSLNNDLLQRLKQSLQRKKIIVCTTSYIESTPITDGVSKRLCVTVWNVTVAYAIAVPVMTIAAIRSKRFGNA